MHSSEAKPDRTRGARASAAWDRHHVKAGWTLVGIIVGGLSGAFIGSSASACGGGGDCSISWEAIEAIGTWFGALGGLLAVGAAIATFRATELARADEQRRMQMTAQEREDARLAQASRVTVRTGMQSWQGDLLTGLSFEVHNGNTDVTVYGYDLMFDLRFLESSLGQRRLGGAHALGPNRGMDFNVSFTPRAGVPRMGAGHIEAPAIAKPDRPEWLKTATEHIILTYVIDNVRWRRVGGAAPQRVVEPGT